MIQIEDQGPVRWLTMARGKGNALNLEFLEAIDSALAEAEAAPVRSVVITGEGSAFSAGVDLRQVTSGGAAYLEAFLPALTSAFRRLTTFPKPVVAAVNGHAIAGGCILMMACDLRIAARGGARIGLTELAVGVPFPTWALEVARDRAGSGRLPGMVYTARTMSVDEAYAQGLVDELVEADHLASRAGQLAAQLAELPAETFQLTKTQVNRPIIEAVAARIEEDDSQVSARWSAPESLAAIESFVERTLKR